jgi:protein SCO1/2
VDVRAPRAPPVIRRPWLWAVFAAVLLAVPTVALVRAQRRALPRLGQVPSFALVDQTGKPFSRADLDGKVWVGDFIFTSCSEVCPRLSAEMASLQRFLRGYSGAALVSISVDPERDTVERLRAYADGFHADASLWHFLTGDAGAVKEAVVRGFKIGVDREPEGDSFAIVHGSRFVLVDRTGAIRGYYDPNEPKEMTQLRAALEGLLR